MLYWVPHCSIALLKSPRPSLLIKRAALGNLKASFQCTHWHRFFPLKKAFSKTYPSFLTLKEGSTFLTKPLFPQGREDVTALRCSEPLRSKVGGASKPCAMFCGMGPPGNDLLILLFRERKGTTDFTNLHRFGPMRPGIT